MVAGCSSRKEVVPAIATRDMPLMTDSLLLKPLDQGRLSSAYGMRYNPITGRRQMHRGIDWAAPRGTAVRAAGDGVVVAAGRLGSYGHYLRIEHGGNIATAYAHLDGYASGLRRGQPVRRGDSIAKVGSTGRATAPHLHYEVLIAGRQVDPIAAASAATAEAAPSARVMPASFQNAGQRDHAPSLEAPDTPALIRIEDLLRLHAP